MEPPPLEPPQPPAMEPLPLRPAHRWRQFLLGLVLGALPLVIWLIFIGAAAADVARSQGGPCCPGLNQLLGGLLAYIVLWIAQLTSALVILAHRTWRFVGYGLLVMLVVGPIVGATACINYQALPVG